MPTTHERFAVALHRTARAWKVALDRRLKHLGLGQAGWMAIGLTARASSPLSQSDLAQELGVEGATVVSLVDRLVKGGWVLRQPSATDRRVNHIVLTESGQALYAQLWEQASAFREVLLAHEDEQVLLQTIALLERLQLAVENMP